VNSKIKKTQIKSKNADNQINNKEKNQKKELFVNKKNQKIDKRKKS
jgi:hypothetical protein